MENSTFPPTSAELDACLIRAQHERAQALHDVFVWLKDWLTGHPHPLGAAKAA